jgi:hypothetical protein
VLSTCRASWWGGIISLRSNLSRSLFKFSPFLAVGVGVGVGTSDGLDVRALHVEARGDQVTWSGRNVIRRIEQATNHPSSQVGQLVSQSVEYVVSEVMGVTPKPEMAPTAMGNVQKALTMDSETITPTHTHP